MEISTRLAYGVLVVDMKGRLDSRTSGYSYDELVRIAKGDNKQVLVNLAELEFLTSAGLRSLLVAAKLLQGSGGILKLCDANESVKQVLETAGFASLLHLYPTEAEAIKSF
ncbi:MULTISPECIES: STAS domain-containing protein [Leptolyngbya]|uniref:Anti-sigma factor antagonist n=1 Tax=Leptolyngbya boryana CZ1 TaxID=3060204 RepID=A0AA97ALD6_LEPBY|nr:MULTISPECIES: STAS domain-containing protein [Leptolyngbya]MBD1856096.1 STAS domain-containing protein [Leptolyngbya sp. FACHB-1624]MCY6490325.1 STAS domain-containing protein [Leptolyngbya sp. GGD]WNZ43943.1 STAS domain-containing protein [Leptolyngbya boryana CZ1]